ncbi:hypothetical protein NDU88_009415 [Pleurodeles waltl]|uniref:Uncharacterized protein n=1 Tax=Pleurodeles waltl TaxID=8319 RepID=A0AAV7RYB9_PLEWA|nr:hypothetical protein NDU88_009415 [Pleurodeles waltl]
MLQRSWGPWEPLGSTTEWGRRRHTPGYRGLLERAEERAVWWIVAHVRLAPGEDFATLKQEIAAEVKDLKRDDADLGQRVDTLEQTHDAHEEEVNRHSLLYKTKTKNFSTNWKTWRTNRAITTFALKEYLHRQSLGTWKNLWSASFAT